MILFGLHLHFNLAEFLNITISVALSMFAGLLIAWLFFRKGKPAVQIAESLWFQVTTLLAKREHPEYFGPNKALPIKILGRVPRDKDVPHATEVLYSPRQTSTEEETLIITAEDQGWNLLLPQGVDVRDDRGFQWHVSHVAGPVVVATRPACLEPLTVVLTFTDTGRGRRAPKKHEHRIQLPGMSD